MKKKITCLIIMFCCINILRAQIYIPKQFDIVIDEIMADPSPQVSLPNTEFIELKNMSGRPLDLSGWKIFTSSSSSGIFPLYILPADSFLILCATSVVSQFASYGRSLGIPSFPSLTNEGSLVSIRSKEGKTIHAVNYSLDWYGNELKAEGGWSLEMIDVHNPCSGKNNWTASIIPAGGTPGRKNSVDNINPDQIPPRLIRTYSIDSVSVVLLFDEPLDSLAAAIPGGYSVSSRIVLAAFPQPPLFDQVLLKLSSPLEKRVVYEVKATNERDCSGNMIGVYNNAKAGLAEESLQKDLVINEILFNPRPNAFDYIELYNNSPKIFDAGKLYLANRNTSNLISSIKNLSAVPWYIFPGGYMVLTEDESSLQNQYLVADTGKILILSSLPSYPDDKGTVVLLNGGGAVIDEVSYSEKWHFALVSNTEGVSLERIDPADSSQAMRNWHSSASTAGYGTPGYKNSQYKQSGDASSTILTDPKIFSPDNDGYDDVLVISYSLDAPGYLANIFIFDMQGRMVRHLVKNDLLARKGKWSWNGLDEKDQKLPVGMYIIDTEIFNLEGKSKQFKNTVVLARRL